MISMNEEYISLLKLSKAMGIDRSGVLKYLKKWKYQLPARRQTLDSRNQMTYAWTIEEAKKILIERMDRCYGVPMSPSDSNWLDWIMERGDWAKKN